MLHILCFEPYSVKDWKWTGTMFMMFWASKQWIQAEAEPSMEKLDLVPFLEAKWCNHAKV